MQIKKVQIILNFYFPGAPDKTRTCTIISHAPEACASTISATSAVSIWCARQDLNLHDRSHAPQACASTSSATSACHYYIKKYLKISRLLYNFCVWNLGRLLTWQ